MKTTTYLFIFLLSMLGQSCTQSKAPFVDKAEIEEILTSYAAYSTWNEKDELNFWTEKLKTSPNQYPYLIKIAVVNNALFAKSGDIKALKAADSALALAAEMTKYQNSAVLRSWARTLISQHQFQKALTLLKQAQNIGDNLEASELMLFDVYMEIGQEEEAKELLDRYRSDQFDYYLRLAKWHDQQGDLNSAISAMSTALDKAVENNNPSNIQWASSNLADFYGHAGEIEKSYQYHSKALSIDPIYPHSIKAIAYIALVADGNTKLAGDILHSLSEQYNTPGMILAKAKVAKSENRTEVFNQHLQDFQSACEDSTLNLMYRNYLLRLLAGQSNTKDKCLKWAKEEYEIRPTVDNELLLAWVKAKYGEQNDAIALLSQDLEQEVSEPISLLLLADIAKMNGKSELVSAIKLELEGAAFELGPVQYNKLQQL